MDPCKKGMEERRYNEMLQQLQQQLISYRESTNSKLFRIEETLQSLVQEMRGIPVDKGVKEHEGFVNPSAKVNHEADRKEMSADSSTHLNLRFPKYDSEKSLTDSIDVYEGAPVFDEDPQEEECDAGEQQLILALGLQTQHSEGPPVFDEDPNKEDHDLEEQKIILALELFDESSKKEEVNEERALAEKYAVQGFSTTYFFVEGVHKPDYGQRTKNGIVTWIKKKVRPGIYTRTTAYDIWRAMGGRWKISEIQLSSFTFLLLLLKVQGHCLLNSEGLALLAFRAAVESDPQGAFLDWNSNDCNPCMWSGVHCVDSQVQMLNLNGLSLEGILAPDLGKLTHLRILILSQNHFSGCIPKEFGGLAMLEIMDLRNNSLNGMIPAEIVGMPSLKCLLLHNNKFEGIAFPQNRNIDMSSELQSDGNYVSGAAAEYGCLNRKFGNCISHCDILSLQKAEPLMKAEPLVKPEIFSTQMKETLNRYLHILPSLKSEEGFFSDNTEVFCNDLPSSSEPHLKNQNNIVRRRLAEQSSNLAAAPASGASAVEPIIALPSTRSSGSFPAVPKEKKKPSLAPAPAEPPQVPDHGIAQPGITNYNGGGHSDDKWKYIVGICVAVFVALVAIVLCIVCRTRAKNIGPWRTGLSGQLQKAFVTGVPKLNRYELETACEDFSNIIETHSCCTIYKGTLSSGVEISVASTSIATRKEWSKRSEIAYRKQIASLSRINHKNFVNLIGFCAEDEPFVRMMVFEFSPNGTLFEHLHITELEHLDWNARVRIIMGTAYCLQYMHGLNPPLPHSSLKSNAIFLTDDYAAKIAEIGFWNEIQYKSRISTENESAHCDLPPVADIETNVYNFGVLLLEIVSGRLTYSEEQGHLVNWASEYLKDNRKFNYMIDPTLKSFKHDELDIICDVVQECIQQDPRKRPSVKEIISKLREVIKVSADAATPRQSPLWWAELEILSAEAA